MEAFACCETLIVRLENTSTTSKEQKTSINYSASVAAVRRCLEMLAARKTEVDDSCDRKARRWNLSIQLVRFQKDVQKV